MSNAIEILLLFTHLNITIIISRYDILKKKYCFCLQVQSAFPAEGTPVERGSRPYVVALVY